MKDRSRFALALAPVAGIAGFLLLWQLAVALFDIERFVLPSPSTVFGELFDRPGFFFHHAWITLWWASLGFAVALVAALLIATLMVHSPFIDRSMQPLAVLIQVTPIIAYAPALAIWLRTLQDGGRRMMLVVTAVVCFVPFLVNAAAGLRSIDPATHELLRIVDASRREVFFKLRLPYALPYLFSAARIGVGLALVGAVLGDWFALRTSGLGAVLRESQRGVQLTPQMWAAVFLLAAIGGTAVLAVGALERLTLRWHSSQRRI